MGASETNYRLRRLINNSLKSASPFFGTALYVDAHLPYRPPEKFIEKFAGQYSCKNRLSNINFDAKKYLAGRIQMTDEDFFVLNCLYDAEISYIDSKIGEVYNSLKKNGILDSTLLIITADHGENLGDHSLMDHRYCLYDTLLKVPLIVRLPDVFKSGQVIDDVVQTIDIFPTLTRIFGNNEKGFDGIPLFDRPSLKENYAYSEYLHPQPVDEKDEDYSILKKFMVSIKAIRDLTHKYILYSDNRELLFNVKDDAAEEHNIVDNDRKRADYMRDKLIQKTGEFEEAPGALHLQDKYKARLKDLGYM